MTLTLSVLVILFVAACSGGSPDSQRPTPSSTPDDAVSSAAPVLGPYTAPLRSLPHVIFRNTGVGARNGLVASVPVTDLSGLRRILGPVCDRVDATRDETVCLVTEEGTTFASRVFDADGHQLASWPLPGIPSRTRISPSGALVAETTFVAGHEYQQKGFSTATFVRRVNGPSYGNLEDFTLRVDGKRRAPEDLNIWGVTFARGDRLFYATAASGGTTWLVHGDLARRTLTSVRTNAECPSLSPDEQLVAYKKRVPARGSHWALAVLDLRTGRETVLGERRSVDDQAEWLDDTTLLYGLPRAGRTGISDVWEIGVGVQDRPRRVIRNAWSPSVVR